MRKKLKAILAVIVGAFAFIMVGATATVSAVEVTNTYTFDLSKWNSISKTAVDGVTYTATGDKVTDKSMSLTYSQSTLTETSKYSNTYYQIGAKGKSANEWFKFEFTLIGKGSITFGYNTGGGSKYYDYYIDGDTAIQIASGSFTTKTDELNSGTHTLLFKGTASSGSNFKLNSLVITDTVESSQSYEDLAVTAISNIGTVEYTDACKTKIDAATAAVEKCTNPSTETISNYSTYTEAIASYNSLASAAVKKFTDAVESIGTVTADSKSAIAAATTAYNALLSAELENTDVITAKTSLDSKNKEYLNNFTEKSTSIIIDETDETLHVASGDKTTTFTEEKTLFTSDNSSIFTGTIGTSIENQSSGKTYNNVKYSDRFKTNATINITDGIVKNALKISATEAGIVEIVGISGKSTSIRNIKICKVVDGNLVVIKDLGNIVGGSDASLYTLPIPSAGDYYIGSDTFSGTKSDTNLAGGINIYKASFTAKSIATPVLEQQETTDGASIRYVCTLDGIVDLSQVTSWTVTMSMEGKNDYSKTFDVFYSAVGGTNGKEKADYTWYLVATLININSSYNEKVIKATFTLNLADGTTLVSNTKEHTINISK